MDERKTPSMKFATKTVHAGQKPEPCTGAVMPPIYMTTTFAQDAPGEHKGYEYTRAGNPNFTIVEDVLAALENARFATYCTSGLGTLTSMISLLSSGDRVVAVDGLYGGTYRLFTQVFNRFGIHFQTVHPHNGTALEDALKQKPKWLLFETPTNPLLEVFDIKALSDLAHKYQVKSIVDNTFASPYFQNPLDLGADIVWHSTTKYIGGHSDVVGGVVMTNDADTHKALHFGRKALGTNPSPFDAWLTTRGIKTLALRMERHAINAMAVAEYLSTHPKVKAVYYPGLPSHRTYAVAKKQMRGFSGMVSMELKASLDDAKKVMSGFKLFTLAESLGGVESLVCHPATMTHASIPAPEREKMGITEGLIRLSVGIEDKDDLIDDLKDSLSRI